MQRPKQQQQRKKSLHVFNNVNVTERKAKEF